ncbi:DUF3122 domain-containing protein [Geminocystis sp. CENA526]|uniref:DUF3122 domain-containing protein n=1 Tax=Geminocystis sp. CENA526 TaxID=1355871 RepID=UPI003D6E297F
MMKKNFFKIIIVSFLLIITINFSFINPSFATIKSPIEDNGGIVYQARNRLTDNDGNVWQLVLFKRLETGKNPEINLRLIAFPDSVNFIHPQELIVSTLNKEDIKAQDEFAEKAPNNSVGQYDFTEILPKIKDEKSIYLLLPLKEKSLSLKIPYPILLEWQEISNK